jgi:hypothetical protein
MQSAVLLTNIFGVATFADKSFADGNQNFADKNLADQ